MPRNTLRAASLGVALICGGCGGPSAPSPSEPAASSSVNEPSSSTAPSEQSAGPQVAATGQPALTQEKDALADRVWMRIGKTDLPGQKLIFLSNGTLVQDSCWETYRLSHWERPSPNQLQWNEDSATIRADIRTLSDTELVLKLVVPDEPQEQRYSPALVPYVCPDMKR